MRIFRLDAEQWFRHPLRDVFPFFADPLNLETITPPWLRFKVRTRGNIEMREGLRIDYSLRLHGIPVVWQTKITVWDPPRRFVDMQQRGPYRLWRHEHVFEERDGGTLVRDRVDYAVPGGLLVEKLLVGRDLKRIFEFRRSTLKQIFR